jgi:hypothetical protein
MIVIRLMFTGLQAATMCLFIVRCVDNLALLTGYHQCITPLDSGCFSVNNFTSLSSLLKNRACRMYGSGIPITMKFRVQK